MSTSSKIDEVYKTLVRIYAYKFPEPLHMLSADVAAIQNQGKTREQAVLELALQTGFKPREYLALLHENRSEEEAASEFLTGEILSISDGDPEIKRIMADAARSKAIDPFERAQYGARKPEPSKLLYLAPLLLGFVGGLIGYVAVKDMNRDMANNLLVLGVLFSFIYALSYFWILW